MKVSVLGPLVVHDEGETIAIGGPRPTHLLAVLVARGASGLTATQLAKELWLDADPPADPGATIRTYVARLRSALGAESILTTSGRYHLSPAIEVDAARFETIIRQD